MKKHKLLSAALITAARLAIPAMARESQVASPRFATNANARTLAGAHSTHRQTCCRNRDKVLPSAPDRNGWGHWAAHYRPMVQAR